MKRIVKFWLVMMVVGGWVIVGGNDRVYAQSCTSDPPTCSGKVCGCAWDSNGNCQDPSPCTNGWNPSGAAMVSRSCSGTSCNSSWSCPADGAELCSVCDCGPAPTATPVPGATNNYVPKGDIYNSPDGYDGATCTIKGWTCDQDRYSQSINVHFYEPDTAGTYRGGVNAGNYSGTGAVYTLCGNQTNRRFDWALPAGLRDGVAHTISVYGINIDSDGTETGSNPRLSGGGYQGQITVTCAAPTPTPTTGAVTYTINSQAVCPAGKTIDPSFNTRMWTLAGPLNFGDAAAPGQHTYTWNTTASHNWVCWGMDDGTDPGNLSPVGTSNPPTSDIFYTCMSNIAAEWWRDVLPGGTYEINFNAPASACLTPTPIPTLTPTPVVATPTPTPTCVLPGVPTGISPTSSPACGATSQIFSWNAVPGATSYHLRIDDQSDAWPWPSANDTYLDFYGGTSYTRPVVLGHTYTWWVHSVNACGYSGAASAIFTVPPGPPAAPTMISPISNPACGTTSMTFQWSPVTGADNYPLRVDDKSNGWTGTCTVVNPGDTCQSVTGTSFARMVTPGEDYGWWVHAVNSCGWSGATEVRFSVPDTCQPGKPELSSVSGCREAFGSAPGVRLNWTAVSPAPVQYNVERCRGAGCTNFALYAQVNNPTVTFLDYWPPPMADGTYRYQVRARYSATYGPYSNIVSNTLACTAPTPTRTPTPTPTPGCTVSLTPSSANIDVGRTAVFTAGVTPVSGSVSRVRFASSNTTRATVSPSSDSSSPYSTTATGVSAGTVTITSTVDMVGRADACVDTSSLVLNPVACQTPGAVSTSASDCSTFSFTWQWPAVTGANQYEVDVFRFPAGPPAGPPYQNNGWRGAGDFGCAGGGTCRYTASGLPDGAYQASVRATDSAGSCTPSSWSTSAVQTLACTTTWFGAGGGDVVAAGGDLRTILPPVPIPPKFISDLVGSNLPGMAMGTQVAGNLTGGNVSSKGWLVNSAGQAWNLVASRPENSYLVMSERLLAQANQPVAITESSLSQSSLNNKVDQALGAPGSRVVTSTGNVGLLRKQNAGNLTLTNINLGPRRAIILVDPGAGDVTFAGSEGQKVVGFNAGGFLAVISANNLLVAPGVGADDDDGAVNIGASGYTPHLEGIFFAGGWFRTGASTQQLRVDGTVIGMQGVALERTFRGVYPAEFFQFRPDLTLVLSGTGLRRKIFQELGVP